MKFKFFNAMIVFSTLLALTFSSLGITPAYAAGVDLSNNLSSNFPGYNYGVSNSQWVAQAFSTDTSHTAITSVVLKMCNNASATGKYAVEIWDATGSGGTPGAKVANVNEAADPSALPTSCDSTNNVSFPVSSVTLNPSTTYYIIVRGVSLSSWFVWFNSDSTAGTGFPSNLSWSVDTGLTWAAPEQTYPFMMEVVADTAAPSNVVTNANDSGAGSLRQAISDVAAGDTITFDPSLSGQTITLTSTLTLSKNVTIDGSALASQVTISGGNAVRVFNINSSVSATLDSLIITKGAADDGAWGAGCCGGGVYVNSGSALTVNNSTFTHNDVGGAAYGGGIFAADSSTLTITNSTFSHNNSAVGSSILQTYYGTMTVANSTFSDNTANDGAGWGRGAAIFSYSDLSIVNSTFSNNQAADWGGAVAGVGSLTLINDTFSGNGGSGGAGIYGNYANPFTIKNTIIANSTTGGDCSGSPTSASNNLIESTGADSCGLTNGSNGNIIGVDPKLGALASNGGSTQTMALQSGSPALGAGDAATCAATLVNNLDQRGVSRPQGGGNCDLGAYESNLSAGHTVHFDGNTNDGGSMSDQTASSSSALTSNAFTKTGYSFNGWNTAADGSGTSYADGASYDFTSNLTLYAQWKVSSYTVHFDGNTNDGGSMSDQTASSSSALTNNAFTKTGYSFNDWNTASDGSGTAYTDGATYPFTSSTTLYAQWTINSYTVHFDGNTNDSGSMSNQTANYNVATDLTSNSFAKIGYSFNGWNTASDGSGTSYSDGASYPFTSSTTLYAQWTALPNHTVTFDANGGSGSMSDETNNIAAALTSSAFTKAGYSFAGWATSSGGSVAYADGGSYDFSADMTLYAQWTALPNHTVTFNANGGSGFMFNEIHNIATALTLNTFTHTGYTFAGWNTAANGSGTSYTDGASYDFSADVTLYAQWVFNAGVLPNGGFETYVTPSVIPQFWTAKNFLKTDGQFTDPAHVEDGSASIQVSGKSAVTKTMTQTMMLKGLKGDSFTFSYWIMGQAVPTKGTCYGFVQFYGTTSKTGSGTPSKLVYSKQIACPTGTYGFQQMSATFTVPAAYSKITVTFTYAKPSGTIWLDNASLTH